MLFQDLPGCCGAVVLRDFGHTSASLHNYKHPLEKIDQFIKDAIRVNRTDAFLIAVTNSHQRKAGVDKVLKANGFRSVAVGTNSGHNSSQPLRTWIYTYPLKMEINRG